MAALQIRDVPDEVRQVLTEQAAARGQSLQAFLLHLVTREARRAQNLVLLERFEGRQDGARVSSSEVLAVLERARAERDDQLVTRLLQD